MKKAICVFQLSFPDNGSYLENEKGTLSNENIPFDSFTFEAIVFPIARYPSLRSVDPLASLPPGSPSAPLRAGSSAFHASFSVCIRRSRYSSRTESRKSGIQPDPPQDSEDLGVFAKNKIPCVVHQSTWPKERKRIHFFLGKLIVSFSFVSPSKARMPLDGRIWRSPLKPRKNSNHNAPARAPSTPKFLKKCPELPRNAAIIETKRIDAKQIPGFTDVLPFFRCPFVISDSMPHLLTYQAAFSHRLPSRHGIHSDHPGPLCDNHAAKRDTKLSEFRRASNLCPCPGSEAHENADATHFSIGDFKSPEITN